MIIYRILCWLYYENLYENELDRHNWREYTASCNGIQASVLAADKEREEEYLRSELVLFTKIYLAINKYGLDDILSTSYLSDYHWIEGDANNFIEIVRYLYYRKAQNTFAMLSSAWRMIQTMAYSAIQSQRGIRSQFQIFLRISQNLEVQ